MITSVNPPTMSCPIIAARKRYCERLVRSFWSPVITAMNRRVGRVVHGVDSHQGDVCDQRVNVSSPVRPQRRHGISEHHAHGPGRNNRPKNPRTKSAPPCPSAIGQKAHHRIEKGIPQPGDEDQPTGVGSADAHGIGVKARLIVDHREKHELGGAISKAVSHFLRDRQLRGVVCRHYFSPFAATVALAVWATKTLRALEAPSD